MSETRGTALLCPSCHQPLTHDERGSVCSNCGWAVVYSDEGDWFLACYRGKVDKAELERLDELLRPWNGRRRKVSDPPAG
jgi:transcription initiation factor IIE alpha subunit